MKGNSKNISAVVIGVLLITIGVLLNEWFIRALFLQHGMARILLARAAIWLFDVLCIVTGIVLVLRRPQIRINLRSVLFMVVTFVLFLVIMEGGLRLFYFVMNKTNYRNRDFSEYLGWGTIAHVHWKRQYKGYGEVEYSTTKYGFRVFGDPHTDKTKILVLGDSFTEARTVSDGFTYYDYLAKNSDRFEIFAYGCGGYGSLQEYMILDKYFDEIQPDIILWQFYSNDLFDNDYELESSNVGFSNHMTRPFYRNGHIEWLYPVRGSTFISSMVKHSYLIRLVNKRLNIVWLELGSYQDILSENHPLVRKAVKTTSDIMGLVRERVGAVPIIAFPVDKQAWVGSAFEDICDIYEIHYLPYIPEKIQEAQASGLAVIGSDGHWNSAGHALAGKMVLDYIQENNLLSKE